LLLWARHKPSRNRIVSHAQADRASLEGEKRTLNFLPTAQGNATRGGKELSLLRVISYSHWEQIMVWITVEKNCSRIGRQSVRRGARRIRQSTQKGPSSFLMLNSEEATFTMNSSLLEHFSSMLWAPVIVMCWEKWKRRQRRTPTWTRRRSSTKARTNA